MLKYKSKTPSSAYAIIPPRKAPCEPVFAQREQRISMTTKRPSTTTTTIAPLCPIPRAMASTTCVMPKHGMLYCYVKAIAQSSEILRRAADIALSSAPPGYDSVRTKRFICPDGSFGVKLLAKLSLRAESRRFMPGYSQRVALCLRATFSRRITLFLLCGVLCVSPFEATAQEQQHEDEIVANLAGGRAIVHVAKDVIVFAAIDQPVERNSIPPR